MDNSDLQRRIINHVTHPKYRPVKPRVIAKQLDLPKELYSTLRRTIKKLVRKGQLAYGPRHVVFPPNAKTAHQLVGVFQQTLSGYGFVRLGNSGGRQDATDIFIPATRTHDAASGDRVAVRVKRRDREDPRRVSGEIVEVLERRTNQFVGTYFEDDGAGFVEVDGKKFSHAIYVGDPGAKNARHADKVVIEMVTFPTHRRVGEGVITEVLGRHGAPHLDTQLIIREFGLPDRFPEEVLQNAREQASQFDESMDDERDDLTSLTVVTIDPKDARDFDDAISLERYDNGHWRLGVHIADVSHFVPPKSPLDREAKKRGTSVYLPDRVIPMLPEIISNNLASLQPERIRYTKSIFIEFTDEGTRVTTEGHAGAIKSNRRFTYEEVDQFLADRPSWKKKLEPDVFDLLGRMHQLAMILRRRRFERGAIEISMPEIKLETDRDGSVCGAHRIENTESHQIIEEFMLAANEAVAGMLNDQEIHFLRRIHPKPDPRKLDVLGTFLRQFGLHVENVRSRFDLIRILEEVAERPEKDAVNYAILRSLKKAAYGPVDEGHYALASKCYCHFTSPIRRYPDLTIHRLVATLISGGKPVSHFDSLVELGDHCSDCERRAESAERELVRLKLLNYLSHHIGMKIEGVVTGVIEFGLFVQGRELPAEGFVHVNGMNDDFYDFDPDTQTLEGHRQGSTFRLGDSVFVEVLSVDLDRRELDFRIVPDSDNTMPARSRLVPRGNVSKKKRRKSHEKKGKSLGKPRKRRNRKR